MRTKSRSKFRVACVLALVVLETRTISLLRLNKKSLNITLANENRGLFSLLAGYIDLVAYCEKLHIEPNVRIENSHYGIAGQDILRSCFEIRAKVNERYFHSIQVLDTAELPLLKRLTKSVDKAKAYQLINRHLVINEELRHELNSYLETHLQEPFIGIHWRGTDHETEAPALEPLRIITHIEEYLIAHDSPPSLIYIATDEKSKLLILEQLLSTRFPNTRIHHRDVARASSNTPLHLGNSQGMVTKGDLARDALLDCLILSKSKILFRTASNLSAWSCIINPELEIYNLNEHFRNLEYWEWRWLENFN